MATGANRRVVERYYAELWNARRLDVLDELLAADFALPDVAGQLPRSPREAFKRRAAAWLGAFPDLRERVDDMIVQGDRVACRYTVTGTHEGEFEDLAPTHRRVRFGGIEIFRIEDGRIAELWCHEDTLSLYEQLGIYRRIEQRSYV